MKNYSEEELQSMSLADASAEIINIVYASTSLIESLEHCKSKDGGKRIRGNGHHIRQEIAEFAEKLLKDRWED